MLGYKERVIWKSVGVCLFFKGEKERGFFFFKNFGGSWFGYMIFIGIIFVVILYICD